MIQARLDGFSRFIAAWLSSVVFTSVLFLTSLDQDGWFSQGRVVLFLRRCFSVFVKVCCSPSFSKDERANRKLEYWHFVLAFGILNGLACSLLHMPCITAVGHYFFRRRGFATGIASSGGPVGGIVFPLMLQKLFANPSLGWGWGIRTLGFLCLGLLVVANALVRSRLPPKQGASIHPDPTILKDRAFLFTTIAVFLLEFAVFIPLAYISSYALSEGFSQSFSFTILTIMNVGSFFGRVVPGYWADKIGPFNSNIIAIVMCIVACLAVWLPFGHTTPGIIIFALLIGFSSGNTISILPVCIGSLCKTEDYGRYCTTCFAPVSVACLAGIPAAGSIVSASGGEYWGLILFTSVLYVLSLVWFLMAKIKKVGWNLLAVF